MKNIFNSLIIIVATFHLISCEKDEASPSTNIAPQLTELLKMDTTLSAPFDTVQRFAFTYDSQGRLSSKLFIETDDVGDTVYNVHQAYSYNSIDTFASRVIRTKHVFGSIDIDRDTTFFHFENGRHVWDSTRQSGRKYIVNRYVQTSSALLHNASIFLQPNTPEWQINSRIFQTKTNGNIVYQIDTVVSEYLRAPVNTIFDRFERSFTYTNIPNPLTKIAQADFNDYLHDDDYMFGGNFVSSNLPSQEISSLRSWHSPGPGSGSYDRQINYTYTLRSDGYPESGKSVETYTNVGVTTITALKLIYRYR